MPTIEHLVELDPADRAAILAPLEAHGKERGFLWGPEPLTLVLRAGDGAIAGGLLGNVQWEWLRIDILAVARGLRGQGWGQRLMEEAERLAITAGCRHAWVDTFSFQAPGFYQRLGYRIFGELSDYPPGQTRYFLTKQLTPNQRDTRPILQRLG